MTNDEKLRQIDEKLSILREGWMDASEAKKESWWKRINAALDERLEVMKG